MLLRLADPRIVESSGLAAGVRSDVLFTHNDSGDVARFFAVDRTGRTRATYSLPGVQARDWEDISRGPGGTLWLGDIGDNRAARDRGLLVHRVREPVAGSPSRLVPTTFRLRYDDGPRDAEALMITGNGRVLVVEKTLSGEAGVYATTGALRPGGVVNVLRRVADVSVPSVTAGDISPDGMRLVLRNYTAAYEWDVGSGDVLAALATEPVRVPLPITAQGEGISYSADGRSLLTSSEGAGAPVFELPRSALAGPDPAQPPRAEPAARPTRFLGIAAGVLVVLLVGLVLALRRRG